MMAVIQSSLVLIAALGATGLFRRASAAMRHAILSAGLIGSLTIPFIARMTPEWNLTISPGFVETPASQHPPVKPAAPPEFPSLSAPRYAQGEAQPVRFFDVLVWMWICGAAAMALRVVVSAARVLMLVRSSTPINAGTWPSALRDARRNLRLGRRVRLLQNDRRVLGVFGFWRPVVFVPCGGASWPEERITVALKHELAHVTRVDWPVQCLAEFACILYWFNPLVWTLRRGIRLESERACDDIVLNSGTDAAAYAAELLGIARTLNHSGRGWSQVLAMTRTTDLERRFTAMLNSTMNRTPLSRSAMLAVSIAAVLLVLPLAALRISAGPAAPMPPRPETIPAPTPLKAAAPQQKVVRVTGRATERPRAIPSAAASTAAAQGLADGAISGAVFDSSGAAVPGVAVTIFAIDETKGATQETAVGTATSGAAGDFGFPALREGAYSLKAELPGFAAYRTERLQVKAAQTTRENIFLSLGKIAQRVTVVAAGEPRPAAAPGGPQRIRVGGNVRAPRLIAQIPPVYPQGVRDAGVEGTVHLEGVIGTAGDLVAVWVVRSGHPDLANAALEAVRQWRYMPTLLNGQPVEVLTDIEVDFKLAQ